jgi:DNA-binding NtrC family response regulator
MPSDETNENSWDRELPDATASPPRPGVLKVFSAGAACFVPRVVDGARAIVVGRDGECDLVVDDQRLSRRHAELRFVADGWEARDLGSRNGTFLDGVRVPTSGGRGLVLGVGDTVFLLLPDVRPMLAQAIEVRGGVVLGPRLKQTWRDLEHAARSSGVVHLCGETGSGKELAARVFHDAGPRARGPFVAVNCAAVPPQIAERLLFGARKGAYTGADVDADGYLGAADGGTLFLDELAELPLEVQAKLLRVLETRELLPLGAAKPRKIDIGLVTATHGDLRAEVANGRFRDDLYFRVGRPQVAVPALRDRPEEIPFLVERALQQLEPPRRPHVGLVEVALTRPWPGNVRELLHEVADAARRAGEDERVKAEHLDEAAGRPLHPPDTRDPMSEAARIREILDREQGNVSRAARALGMHRTQLRRWLARNTKQ